MRILHCIPTMASGGSERQLAYLVTEQVRQRHQVDVAFAYGGANLERLHKAGAQTHHLRTRGNHDPSLVYRLIRLIRRQRPDVVQTWLTQMDVLGGAAALACRVPWVVSERSSALGYPPTLKNRARSLLAQWADAIVANSAGGVDYWAARVGARPLVREIPNALPVGDIDAAAPASDAEIGLEPGQRLVLIVGRLNAEKNLPVLIDALALAAKRTPFVVRICGEGIAPPVARQIETYELSKRFVMVGYNPRVWSWMKRAALFVSLSLFEGSPNAVFEAALARCPILLSDIPAHRERFDERSARFVGADQSLPVADAIVDMLDGDPGQKERLRLARERAEGLSAADVEGRYGELYRDLMSRHRESA